jgi:hypothetical protein
MKVASPHSPVKGRTGLANSPGMSHGYALTKTYSRKYLNPTVKPVL